MKETLLFMCRTLTFICFGVAGGYSFYEKKTRSGLPTETFPSTSKDHHVNALGVMGPMKKAIHDTDQEHGTNTFVLLPFPECSNLSQPLCRDQIGLSMSRNS
jgi:hypothetical protein